MIYYKDSSKMLLFTVSLLGQHKTTTKRIVVRCYELLPMKEGNKKLPNQEGNKKLSMKEGNKDLPM